MGIVFPHISTVGKYSHCQCYNEARLIMVRASKRSSGFHQVPTERQKILNGCIAALWL